MIILLDPTKNKNLQSWCRFCSLILLAATKLCIIIDADLLFVLKASFAPRPVSISLCDSCSTLRSLSNSCSISSMISSSLRRMIIKGVAVAGLWRAVGAIDVVSDLVVIEGGDVYWILLLTVICLSRRKNGLVLAERLSLFLEVLLS